MIGFGKFSKKTEPTTITSLTDNRLVKIDPQELGFFDEVLNFKSTNKNITNFIEAVAEVKEARIEAFYRPIYDPSDAGDHMVTYMKGMRPAIGHTYNWWVKTASNMPAVEGRHWCVATEYQYYAFLVWLINQLIKVGKTVEETLNQIIIDSKELGHYCNSEGSTKCSDYEPTGSRCICGIYDLANVFKILACANQEAGDFWIGGGCYFNDGNYYPLANLDYYYDGVDDDDESVGLLVL